MPQSAVCESSLIPPPPPQASSSSPTTTLSARRILLFIIVKINYSVGYTQFNHPFYISDVQSGAPPYQPHSQPLPVSPSSPRGYILHKDNFSPLSWLTVVVPCKWRGLDGATDQEKHRVHRPPPKVQALPLPLALCRRGRWSDKVSEGIVELKENWQENCPLDSYINI